MVCSAARLPSGASHTPVGAQKPSPRTKFGNPADLVNKFVHFVGVLLVVPHYPILGLEVWVGP